MKNKKNPFEQYNQKIIKQPTQENKIKIYSEENKKKIRPKLEMVVADNFNERIQQMNKKGLICVPSSTIITGSSTAGKTVIMVTIVINDL